MADKSRTAEQSKGSRFISTGERIGGYIGWAFVLAMTLHAVFLPFVRAPGQPVPSGQPPSPITVRNLATQPPKTPPPRATPTPPPHPAVRPRENQAPRTIKAPLAKVRNATGRVEPPVQSTTGPMTGNVVPQESASPLTAATVAACPDPNRDAHTVSLATPEYPPIAVQEGDGEHVVQVAVTISPAGDVVSESIVETSGVPSIDRDALRVARETTYAPRIENCQPVLGTYKYVIDYQSN